ncbi:MAG: T9SS type A sorting domain-containing protein [Ignavibacteriae bacterium]|nr:T9SS type A sorting domain-containing protein [Ignavibacteriota bacterium]
MERQRIGERRVSVSAAGRGFSFDEKNVVAPLISDIFENENVLRSASMKGTDMKQFLTKCLLCFLGVICALQPAANAQGYSEQQIPHPFAGALSAELLLSQSNTIHLVGIADEVMFWIFEDMYGRNTLFHVQRGPAGFATSLAIPDTGAYRYGTLMGNRDRFSHDEALSGDTVYVIWSKLREFVSDLPPVFWRKPIVKCYSRIGDSWSRVLEMQSANDPHLALDAENTMHFVWESVSPMRNDSNYFFYRSRILYCYRLSSGGISRIATIDSGYAPQIQTDRDGRAHILWLRADSVTSPTFKLMYSSVYRGSVQTPVVLRESIPSTYDGFSIQRPNVFFSVDTLGSVHAAWDELRGSITSRFFAVTYNGAFVMVDSSAAYETVGTSFSCAFSKGGIAHAAWSVREGSEHTLFYSNSRSGHLFDTTRLFRSMVYASQLRIILNRSDTPSAILLDNVGLRLLRNLESGPDTLSSPIPNARFSSQSRKPVLVDEQDHIWLTYSKQGGSNVPELWLLRSDQPLEVNEPATTPVGFGLDQNYPNPFNPTTTIRYALTSVPSPSGRGEKGVRVILKDYDLLGREVATLVNEVKEPGSYTVQWNAEGLASGVYLYQLRASGFVQTKKLIFTK